MNKNISSYKIKISGLNLHHVLEYFESKNIPLYNISRDSTTTLYIEISAKDFKTFKKSELYRKYKVEIVKYKGLANIARSIFTKIGITLGIITCLLCCFTFTNNVTEIILCDTSHVCANGENCIYSSKNKQKLFEILENNGIKTGAKKSSLINSRDLEKILMLNFKQVAGATLRIEGVRVYLDIVEAKLNTSTKTRLVAPASGIILSTDVTSGKLLVKNGDIVLAGDTLVEQENGKDVCASIKIRAFYHDTYIYNENQTTYKQSGKTKVVNNIELFGLKLNSNNNVGYTLYESQTKCNYLFFNLILPIKVRRTTYKELIAETTKVPYDDIKDKINNQLKDKLLTTLPTDADVKNTTFTTSKEGTRVRIDCYIEALIEIDTK